LLRFCFGVATPSVGPLDRVSCWSPLGVPPGVVHAPNLYFNSSRHHIRVWIFLRSYLSSNSIVVYRFMRPHLVINVVLIAFFLFLLVFLIALAGISLRGDVTCVSRVITNEHWCSDCEDSFARSLGSSTSRSPSIKLPYLTKDQASPSINGHDPYTSTNPLSTSWTPTVGTGG
jgi:hypothetical protein